MTAPEGMVRSVVEGIKSLTLTNVLVIILLLLALAPAYLAYRIINDEALRTIVFSSFRVIPLYGTDCQLREASEIGGDKDWFLTHSFAFSGNDRWYVGVNFPEHPDEEEIKEYCDVLANIIIFARDNTQPKPVFPKSGPAFTVEP
jgi:hypothetical protein